jgi:protein-disulfide isomerase
MKKFVSLSILSLFILTACGTPVDSTPQKLGRANAKVLIEEFSDPECPACAAISPQVEQFVKDNPELARLEYYHYPLSYHEHAFIAAEASECAGDQGKFWEYLGTIFANQSSLSEDYLYNIADSLELDRTAFDACVDDHTYKGKILAHMAEGTRRRLPGTPTLYVNGEMIRWSDAETFKAYLESL